MKSINVHAQRNERRGSMRLFGWLFVVLAFTMAGAAVLGQHMLLDAARRWADAAGYKLTYNKAYISGWRELTVYDVRVHNDEIGLSGRLGSLHVALDVKAWLQQQDVVVALYGRDATAVVGGITYDVTSFAGTVQSAAHGWAVHDLTVVQQATHWWAAGTVGDDGALAVDVAMETAELQEAIPLLAPYGVAGPATLSGLLHGSLADWELTADAAVGPGEAWGRNHVSGAGTLRLTANDLSFHDVTLWQLGGTYALAGRLTFAAGHEPGRLDLQVDSTRGRLQELVALFRDDLPVAGKLDGTLHFNGPFGDMQIIGDVTVDEGVLWDQPLDRLQGKFVWQGNMVHVVGGQAELGSGTGTFDGTIDLVGDAGDVTFAISDWPLGFTRAFDAHFGDVLGGFVDVPHGRLTGSLLQPRLEATVAADSLRVGPTHFKSITGSVAANGAQLQFTDVLGVRVGGGEYGLSGAVHILPQGDSRVALHITVTDDRLARVLQLANADWPQLPTDGLISGDIKVGGLLAAPTADFDLRLRERLLGNKELRLGMRLAEGAWRVRDMGFEGI